MTRFLDGYAAVLLDLNGTFMFGEDRFGTAEDFYATYRTLGGHDLNRATVERAIRDCYAGMQRDYVDPARVDDFPSLAQGFFKYGGVTDAEECERLVRVFASHEIGRIPDDYAAALRRLAATHRLGLLSNIWAPPQPWMNELRRAGVDALWRAVLFSSSGRSIKPSRQLLGAAVAALDVQPAKTLFVGDNLRVDIEPAKRMGLGTVWISATERVHPLADRVVASLLELEAL